jgi:hypothetical protein
MGECRSSGPTNHGTTSWHLSQRLLAVPASVRGSDAVADKRPSGLSDVLSDRNGASLMCRHADDRLQLRENSMVGLGRSAGEAQQATGSWPGSV